jgi:hypothetical protein
MMKGSQSYIEVNIMASLRNSSHSNKLKMAKQQKEFVDDDHDINLTLRLVLEGSGFKVDSFTNALLALASFRSI